MPVRCKVKDFAAAEIQKIWDSYKERRIEEGHATTSLVIDLHQNIKEAVRQYCRKNNITILILDLDHSTPAPKREPCRLFKKIQSILQTEKWAKVEPYNMQVPLSRQSTRHAVQRVWSKLESIGRMVDENGDSAYEVDFHLDGIIDLINEHRKLDTSQKEEEGRGTEKQTSSPFSHGVQSKTIETGEDEQVNTCTEKKLTSVSHKRKDKQDEEKMENFVGNLTRGEMKLLMEAMPDFTPMMENQQSPQRKRVKKNCKTT